MAQVRIYTLPGCSSCRRAKEFLRENGIAYDEKDLGRDESARRELEEKGITSTPVLVIDGETVVGFDPGRIRNLLGMQ